MVCNVIEDCKCYAYSDVFSTKALQFCGTRKGPNIVPCPAECCADGCPGQDRKAEPREPFRIIERPRKPKIDRSRLASIVMFIALVITFLLYRRDLKNKFQYKV